ncbi:MAG: RNA-binding domain-containing protein [Thermoproteota archaeon]
MRSPNISCKIEILSSINSSEDPKKIETAILNIFPDAKIKTDNFSIISNSKDLHLLEKIYDVIHSNQSQKIYQRQLEKNLENDSTWFYLNKQAAFVGTVALCEEAEESPLGPIKVVLTSSNIDRIIDWLILRN